MASDGLRRMRVEKLSQVKQSNFRSYQHERATAFIGFHEFVGKKLNKG